jgi:hypothetical protein
MADVGGVSKPGAIPPLHQDPIGPSGPLGQPTGQPAPAGPGQTQLLPDVLAGSEPTQFIAAEQMRSTGGASATEALLGLDRQPTILGAFFGPPGNGEALRHLTPAMRRAVVRLLLDKQRARMRGLASALHERQEDQEEGPGEQQIGGAGAYDRARSELFDATRMLDLLETLLEMQDYTLGRMGSFSKG